MRWHFDVVVRDPLIFLNFWVLVPTAYSGVLEKGKGGELFQCSQTCTCKEWHTGRGEEEGREGRRRGKEEGERNRKEGSWRGEGRGEEEGIGKVGNHFTCSQCVTLHPTAMHNTFQRDLYRLRLEVARSYVKAVTASLTPITSSQDSSLKISAQVCV